MPKPLKIVFLLFILLLGGFGYGQETPKIILTNDSISNQTPLPNLGANEVFTAGDFPVTVKEVSGSDGVYTGSGFISVPYLENIKIEVNFKDITINTSYQLIKGIVETSYDASEKNVIDIDNLISGIKELVTGVKAFLNNYKGTPADKTQAIAYQKSLDQAAKQLLNNPDLSQELKTKITDAQANAQPHLVALGNGDDCSKNKPSPPTTKGPSPYYIVDDFDCHKTSVENYAETLETATSNLAAAKPASFPITVAQLHAVFGNTDPKRLAEVVATINKNSDKFEINKPLRMSHFLAQTGFESGGFTDIPEEGTCFRPNSIIVTFRTKQWNDSNNLEGEPIKTAKCPDFRNGAENIPKKYICKENIPSQKIVTPQPQAGENLLNYTYRSEFGNRKFETGDGYKYRGRGIIQLTWQDNYKNFNNWLHSKECDCPHYETINVIKDPELIAEDNDLAVLSAMWFWSNNGLNKLADADKSYSITYIINSKGLGRIEREKLTTKFKEQL